MQRILRIIIAAGMICLTLIYWTDIVLPKEQAKPGALASAITEQPIMMPGLMGFSSETRVFWGIRL